MGCQANTPPVSYNPNPVLDLRQSHEIVQTSLEHAILSLPVAGIPRCSVTTLTHFRRILQNGPEQRTTIWSRMTGFRSRSPGRQCLMSHTDMILDSRFCLSVLKRNLAVSQAWISGLPQTPVLERSPCPCLPGNWIRGLHYWIQPGS